MQISTDIFATKTVPCGNKTTVETDNSFMFNINININIILFFFSLISHWDYGPLSDLVKFILMQHFFGVSII